MHRSGSVRSASSAIVSISSKSSSSSRRLRLWDSYFCRISPALSTGPLRPVHSSCGMSRFFTKLANVPTDFSSSSVGSSPVTSRKLRFKRTGFGGTWSVFPSISAHSMPIWSRCRRTISSARLWIVENAGGCSPGKSFVNRSRISVAAALLKVIGLMRAGAIPFSAIM